MDQLRWGILGTARIADSVIPAIRASSNSVLAAVASRNGDRAASWAAERGVPGVFGSYEDLLASDIVDAVYIPLPNALHREWAIRAAERGKHILCEKPLAATAQDAEAMIRAAETGDVLLMEAFMYRFHPQIAALRDVLATGSIGSIRLLRAQFGFLLDQSEDVRWSRELAGGALLDVGCYCVDVARLMTGTEPVAATAAAVWAATGVDESLAGVLEFPGGVMAEVSCSLRTGAGMDQGLQIAGTGGRVQVPRPFRADAFPTRIVVDNLDATGAGYVVDGPPVDAYQHMVTHFADAVLHGQPLACPPSSSLANMRVLDALSQSARTGQRVPIAPAG